MTQRRLAFAMLAVAGVLVAHTIGYALGRAGPGALDHGYVVPALGAALPMAVLLAAIAAVAEARRAGLAFELSVARLASAQVCLFLAQEVGERMVTGHLASLTSEPGVVFGFLAQVPVALLLCLGVRLARRAAVRLLRDSGPADVSPATPSWPPPPFHEPARRHWSPLCSRAPPGVA